MKRYPFILNLLIVSATLFTQAACSKADDNNSDLQETVVQNNVQSGEWRITSFIDDGNDETSDFNGYIFNFGSNGTVTSSSSSTTYTGTWSVTRSNSNDDSPDSDLKFNILFNLTNQFEEISEDWNIISQSSSKIELIHISGGNGGTDNLTFQRI